MSKFVENQDSVNEVLSLEEYSEWIEEKEDELSYASRERLVAQFIQHIWDNFQNNTGPCGDCPFTCLAKERPGFGGFNHDSELMIIGKAPGGGEGDYRTRNNTNQGEEIPKLHQQRGYSPHFDLNWSQGSKAKYTGKLRSLFEDFPTTFNIDFQEAYLTNALKCSELDDSSELKVSTKDGEVTASEANQTAWEQCKQYLRQEITVVNPSVILALGVPTIDAIADALDRDLSEPFAPTDDNLEIRSFGPRPYIVPADKPEFGSNVKRRPHSYESHNEYLEAVVTRVNQLLDDPK